MGFATFYVILTQYLTSKPLSLLPTNQYLGSRGWAIALYTEMSFDTHTWFSYLNFFQDFHVQSQYWGQVNLNPACVISYNNVNMYLHLSVKPQESLSRGSYLERRANTINCWCSELLAKVWRMQSNFKHREYRSDWSRFLWPQPYPSWPAQCTVCNVHLFYTMVHGNLS